MKNFPFKINISTLQADDFDVYMKHTYTYGKDYILEEDFFESKSFEARLMSACSISFSNEENLLAFKIKYTILKT
jgi:hypothetical protein